uniref:F-box domain-containing protein n=2 Tax=Steinernema glaseri TaxID=37863 RepID=A0A1I7ZMP0_9BILA
MENVPPVFIKSVLCLSRLSTVEPFQKLLSHSWSQPAAEQMTRRKNWELKTVDCLTNYIGFLSRYKNSENAHEYASFQEFPRMDPSLNQITGIWLKGPDDDEEPYDYESNCKGTKITTEQDVTNFQRRFFPRINYNALDSCNLVEDDIGLHSATLHHLADKQMLINDVKYLNISYEDPASTDLLKGLMQKRVLIRVRMSGEWPAESTVPLIEALIPQRQLEYFSYGARINLSETFFPSLIDDWRNDTMPQRKRMFFHKLQTPLPLESGVYPHPKLDEQLEVELEPFWTFLNFSSATDPE